MGDYAPKYNGWYKGSGEYSGEAILRTPDGRTLTNDATVNWDDLGRLEAKIVLAEIRPATAHSLFQLADFIDLTVNTPLGTLRAPRALITGSNWAIGGTPTDPSLELTAPEAEFDRSGAAPPTFWVAPLINFNSRFVHISDFCDRHPLRLFPTPRVPDNLTGTDLLRAQLEVNSKNKLIPFTFAGNPGFIEPLDAFQKVVADLEGGFLESAVTALMIGSVPSGLDATLQAVQDWFPWDYLLALGVATGIRVEIPFVEFRTPTSDLSKRLHLMPRTRPYRSGTKTIDELFSTVGSRGVVAPSPTGALMEAVLSSVVNKAYLRSVANQLIASGGHSVVIEDVTDSLVRGLEALTTAKGVASQNLLDGVPTATQAKITNILSNAAFEIDREASAARASGDMNAGDRIGRIAGRTRSAAQKEAMFGIAVSALAKQFGLMDEQVLNQFLGLKTPASTWAQMLSRIRGAVIHQGFITLKTRAELLEIYAFIRHLHDLLSRLFLLDVGYSGTYQPAVSEWAGESKELNWVGGSTSPAELRLS
jgi:hypothetical protein